MTFAEQMALIKLTYEMVMGKSQQAAETFVTPAVIQAAQKFVLAERALLLANKTIFQ